MVIDAVCCIEVYLLSKGKKVRRNTWTETSFWYVKDDFLCDKIGRKLCDWEVVEDKKMYIAILDEVEEIIKKVILNKFDKEKLMLLLRELDEKHRKRISGELRS